MNERQISDDTIAKWRAWARQLYGDNNELVEVAANAAIAALRENYSREDAAKAGKAAAARVNRTDTPAPEGMVVGQVPPAPPGKIVGTARNVKRGYQWGTSLQILDFDLSRSVDLPSIGVQIRGLVLNGRIDEGDEIVIDRPRNDARFVQADRVFNRTKHCSVEAPKGASSLFAHTEAAYGKGAARAHRGLFIGVMVWVAAIFLLVVGGFIFISCDSGQGHSSSAWWCEQAEKTGTQKPPGC